MMTASSCSSAGGSDADGPRVAGLPQDVGGIVVRDAARESTWVYGAMPICLESAGQVRLLQLRPSLVNSAELVSFGVRLPGPGVEGIATVPGPLPSTYQPLEGLTVSDVCAEGELAPELALEVRPNPDGSSAVDGVELVYDDGSGPQTARYHLDFVMCQGTDIAQGDPKLQACGEPPQ